MHYAVIGLGFGDEGKGITVARLCREFDIDYVVRYSGGAQAGHTVVDHGRKHIFKQFGSGTFLGVPTYMAETAVFDPWAFQQEDLLLERFGVERNFTAHPDALVSTVYHARANKARNEKSGHGTVGFGIGETKFYQGAHIRQLKAGQWFGNHEVPSDIDTDIIPLRVRHLISISKTTEILRGLAKFYKPLTGDTGYDPEIVALTYHNAARSINVEDLTSTIRNTSAVFESSQGVLLDENHGFHPHTTWSDLTKRPVEHLLAGKPLHTVGVTRTYHTRHGAGPFPGEDDKLTSRHHEPDNRSDGIQGRFRVGKLNLPLLAYGISIVRPDSLSVTHTDKSNYGVYPHNEEKGPGHPLPAIEGMGVPVGMYGYGPNVADYDGSPIPA